MKDVLIEEKTNTVSYGDVGILDECADRCKHTNLMKLHPLDRHKRILDALGKSELYECWLIRIWLGNREGLARCFKLKK